MNRRREPTVPVCIRIPESLNMELRILLCDPRTGAPRYGTWGRTIERALREWVEAQKVAAQ